MVAREIRRLADQTAVATLDITKMVKEMVPTFEHYEIQDEENLQVLQQALELRASNPRAYDEQTSPEVKAAVDLYDETDQATIAVQNGEVEEEVEKILENRPTVEIMNPAAGSVPAMCARFSAPKRSMSAAVSAALR